MTDDKLQAVAKNAERQKRQWHSLDELADKMLVRAKQGKRVSLSPATAEFIAMALKARS